MSTTRLPRRSLVAAAGLALGVSLTACGGNVGDSASSEEAFPSGPVTLLIGQDPGGSTDLIGRALAEQAADELGVAITVENRPGANGALAARELAGAAPDGQTLMVFNGSLAYITPLAVAEDEAVDIEDYEVVTGVSQDDYVLVTSPDSGLATLADLSAAGRPLTYGTTGVGTGSQLSQALLFQKAGVQATAVPFDGGAPTVTAVLGGQVDVGSVQLGEAKAQIDAGELVPLVVFADERNPNMPDVPTAVESGIEASVQQSRAVVAPQGTPQETIDTLRAAFQTAFDSQEYQDFNTSNLLVPNEVPGDELLAQWTEARDEYSDFVQESGVDLGGQG
ncbi:Bug family tripartite tricarboxylate transporter substrate binding protein [Kineococcus sp. SYSU DK003]|uniref:Bug family tripartite tricarboxylate transporter substrate binding protein n=1 Tax=Kineococcus sp. SYSU DK003 TaxID=3383124 RepID=UPI003D7E7CD6